MRKRLHENIYVKGWVENGIMFAVFKPEILDLPAVKSCVELRIESCEGQSYPILADVRNLVQVSKEARDYLATDRGALYVLATAVVVKSQLSRLLTNFFLQVSRPVRPLKIFNDYESAEEWLRQFVQEESV